ncbi:MAG: hypothetical protein AAF480_03360, partial [Actinomycetota bacterium]
SQAPADDDHAEDTADTSGSDLEQINGIGPKFAEQPRYPSGSSTVRWAMKCTVMWAASPGVADGDTLGRAPTDRQPRSSRTSAM